MAGQFLGDEVLGSVATAQSGADDPVGAALPSPVAGVATAAVVPAAVPAALNGSAPMADAAGLSWEQGLHAEALALLETGRTDVWDVLTRRFETRLIQTALANTRGRRIEAAHKLGIGRNTITRKIQELDLE